MQTVQSWGPDVLASRKGNGARVSTSGLILSRLLVNGKLVTFSIRVVSRTMCRSSTKTGQTSIHVKVYRRVDGLLYQYAILWICIRNIGLSGAQEMRFSSSYRHFFSW